MKQMKPKVSPSHRRQRAQYQGKPLGQVSDVDVRLLRVFKAVVESGGLAAAELELNIGRSTISRHLKDLEIRLGVVLCSRGRSGFALTPEGETIYRAALNLMGSLDQFRSQVAGVHEQMVGRLSVALFDKTVTNPAAHIDRAIQRFHQVAPEVDLHLHVGTLNGIESGVMDGKYQLGVIPLHRESSSLNYQPLFSEAMSLYCGNYHPAFSRAQQITATDLTQLAYVGLGYHSPNMSVSHQRNLIRSASGYDQEAVATLILSGVYIGYLPDHYAESFVAQGLMRMVGDSADPERSFGYQCQFAAITKPGAAPNRLAEAFLSALVECHL